MYTPSLHTLTDSRLLRYYGCIGLPAAHLDSWRISLLRFPYLFPIGDSRISAVPLTYLSAASPGSPTGGCSHILALADMGMLSAACRTASTISDSDTISRLNHFTFVPALPLPVLRLGLALLLRPQGLVTGGWLGLTRQGFPACNVNSLPRLTIYLFSASQEKSALLISQLALYTVPLPFRSCRR